MWERRNRQKVQSDGSVTDEFLDALYAESVCHYCRNQTPESDRTADHKTPLSRGGLHSAANLVMACWSCNCGKRDLTEQEYIQWRSLHVLSATPSPPTAAA